MDARRERRHEHEVFFFVNYPEKDAHPVKNEVTKLASRSFELPKDLNKPVDLKGVTTITFWGHGGLRNDVISFGVPNEHGTSKGYTPEEFIRVLKKLAKVGKLPNTVTQLNFVGCDIGLSTPERDSWLSEFKYLLSKEEQFKHITDVKGPLHTTSDRTHDAMLVYQNIELIPGGFINERVCGLKLVLMTNDQVTESHFLAESHGKLLEIMRLGIHEKTDIFIDKLKEVRKFLNDNLPQLKDTKVIAAKIALLDESIKIFEEKRKSPPSAGPFSSVSSLLSKKDKAKLDEVRVSLNEEIIKKVITLKDDSWPKDAEGYKKLHDSVAVVKEYGSLHEFLSTLGSPVMAAPKSHQDVSTTAEVMKQLGSEKQSMEEEHPPKKTSEEKQPQQKRKADEQTSGEQKTIKKEEEDNSSKGPGF